MSSFGAMLELSGVTLECNDIDLDGEMFGALTPEIADLEGNVCGCGGMERTCKMLSSGLAPPPPLEDPSN